LPGLVPSSPPSSGQRNEQKLVVETLKARFVEPLPEKLIGDKAYDPDPLDAELAQVGAEMISPHHPRRRRKTQDAGSYAATGTAGGSSGSSPGCSGSDASSVDGSGRPRASSAFSSSRTPRSSGGGSEF